MERLPESRVQLEITAEEEESAEAMRRAVRKVGNQITLPGFRRGKAPRVMIEQAYGPEVFAEEANRFLMTDLYRQALEQEDIVPVGDPEVDIASTDPLSFTVIVPVFPEIDPGDYQAVRIDPIDAAVDDDAVDELVEALRKAHSPWVDPESEGLEVGAGLELTPKRRLPREGDQVTIDYTVQMEGEDAEEPIVDATFVLGESGLLEPIEDAIKGLRVGASSGFSVPFAADDETIDESVRGKTLAYVVTLKGLKERDLPRSTTTLPRRLAMSIPTTSCGAISTKSCTRRAPRRHARKR
jgi:trigger factor